MERFIQIELVEIKIECPLNIMDQLDDPKWNYYKELRESIVPW